jgi:hypothetical protein
MHSTEPGAESFNRHVLTPDGHGTRIDRTMELSKPSGFQGVMFPLVMAALIKPGANMGMRMLETNLQKGV